jgi:hypothetical protein
MEQLSMLSAVSGPRLQRGTPACACCLKLVTLTDVRDNAQCPGFYHNATISLRCPTAPNGRCTLRVAVDGNPMQPLLDGMPLRQGGTLSLTTTDKQQSDLQKLVPVWSGTATGDTSLCMLPEAGDPN